MNNSNIKKIQKYDKKLNKECETLIFTLREEECRKPVVCGVKPESWRL